jgi:uncharacterized membrane protein YcaP (DUF421 family)
MREWWDIDFRAMFTLEVPALEVVLRGTLVYLGLCVLLRVIPKRNAGSVSPSDMVLAVMIGGVGVAALVREFMSVPGVLILVTTVMVWSYVIDWVGYHVPRLRPVLREPPTRLVEDGRVLARNLRRELITEDELMTQLRKEGVRDVGCIREACLEADGSVSVVRRDEPDSGGADSAGTTDSARCGEGPAAGEGGAAGGHPADPTDSDAPPDGGGAEEVRRFVEAAHKLRERLEWHQAAADRMKALLAEHGVRAKPGGRPAPKPPPAPERPTTTRIGRPDRD